MESDDMLDVLHYMFEEDMHVSTLEEVQSISKAREIIYKDLYNREYKYSITVDSSAPSDNFDGMMSASGGEFYPEEDAQGNTSIIPFDPNKPVGSVTKKFIPATNVREDLSQPFGVDVDEPLK
jgi:hypothetical protein